MAAWNWVAAPGTDSQILGQLDVPLADAVATWIAVEWPWERVHRPGR